MPIRISATASGTAEVTRLTSNDPRGARILSRPADRQKAEAEEEGRRNPEDVPLNARRVHLETLADEGRASGLSLAPS